MQPSNELNTAPSGAVERIHIIYKTHLDVGFTDFARNVVQNYFTSYIPKAIRLARELRESGSDERFVWTTGSWLIYQYLEQAGPAERKEMEEAIRAGDIAWHALPFTTHSENMNASLFRFGLSLSQELDKRFGRHTIAAKMTDVPGHTRAIVPLLADAGVEFLHIGVNGASTPPDVPDVFRWVDPSGKSVMVMYHKGSYGELMTVPGLPDAIYFAHTGDNLGPQGIESVQKVYAELHSQFPQAKLVASTLDGFALRLAAFKDNLPILTAEIGDTWIHGVETDPVKEARYRELLRLRERWLSQGVSEKKLHNFSLGLLPISEHTWGLDLKTHLGDWENYANENFHARRGDENYQKMEASWQEQRDYLNQAIEALPDPALKQQAETALIKSVPRPIDRTDYRTVAALTEPIDTDFFTVSFDPQSGSITSLVEKSSGNQWSGLDNPLASFWQQTFSVEDYERFYEQYIHNKRHTAAWARPDFTKPGLDRSPAASHRFDPLLVWAGQSQEEEGLQFLMQFNMPEESWRNFGAPKVVTLGMQFSASSPEIRFNLQWFNKTASRLPEAFWFSFIPMISQPQNWRMNKLDEWISPSEVIKDGNRHLHAVNRGVFYKDGGNRLLIEPLDTALVAPGQPSMLDFNNRQPDLRKGMHFNLYNNLWGTNFPMWFGEDLRFRFIARFGEAAEIESTS